MDDHHLSQLLDRAAVSPDDAPDLERIERQATRRRWATRVAAAVAVAATIAVGAVAVGSLPDGGPVVADQPVAGNTTAIGAWPTSPAADDPPARAVRLASGQIDDNRWTFEGFTTPRGLALQVSYADATAWFSVPVARSGELYLNSYVPAPGESAAFAIGTVTPRAETVEVTTTDGAQTTVRPTIVTATTDPRRVAYYVATFDAPATAPDRARALDRDGNVLAQHAAGRRER